MNSINKQEETKCVELEDIFDIKEVISEGACGLVRKGIQKTNKEQVAIKLEKPKPQREQPYISLLEIESKILEKLGKVPGIPSLIWKGTYQNQKAIAIPLLGVDLFSLWKELHKFSLKTVIMIAYQLIEILEKVHNFNIIHRDIKPENILLGKKGVNDKKLFLIDFGLSKELLTSESEKISENNCRTFVGTCRFASEHAHFGKTLGRKDDLESLVYMLIFLAKGKLPWQNIRTHDLVKRIALIGKCKASIRPEELCENLPSQLLEMLKQIKKLNSNDIPDQKFLKNLMKNAAENQLIIFDWNWDWFNNQTLESAICEKRTKKKIKEIEKLNKVTWEVNDLESISVEKSNVVRNLMTKCKESTGKYSFMEKSTYDEVNLPFSLSQIPSNKCGSKEKTTKNLIQISLNTNNFGDISPIKTWDENTSLLARNTIFLDKQDESIIINKIAIRAMKLWGWNGRISICDSPKDRNLSIELLFPRNVSNFFNNLNRKFIVKH